MANILKIKRGKKAGLPILADGELGFCKDTNELYIGNGGTTNVKIGATSMPASGGNADTATKLATAKTINGVAFDGSANITILAAANGGTSTNAGYASFNGNYAQAQLHNELIVAAGTSVSWAPGDIVNYY